MNAIENQVRQLVKVELSAANKRFPQFHSAHEGWAVILEEVNELSAETALVEKTANELWEHIKSNKPSGVIGYDADWVGRYAINAACEAIQIAAMCKKFLEMEAQHDN